MAHVHDRRWRRNPETGEREKTGYDGPKPWLARWRDPDGQQKSRSFARKADAENHLAGVQHRILSGEYIDPDAGRITLKDWLEQWRERQVHRPSTQSQVEIYFRKHVYPELGERELRSLRPSDIQAWVTGRSKVLAPGSVELAYRHLSKALRDAERDRLIGRSPCDGITLPRKAKDEVSPPTLEQVEALADGIASRYRATVVLASAAGLRLGEVLGLQLDRVDFLRGSIRVDQQLITPNKGPISLGPTKTESSVRTVPVPKVVVDELAAHVATYPPVDGFVFTTELDHPVRRSTFQDAWRRAKKAAGVDGVRFHDLRHFYASALISSGCSVKAVQKALGHASATETLETYAHLWPDDEDRTRAAIQAVFTGGSDDDEGEGGSNSRALDVH